MPFQVARVIPTACVHTARTIHGCSKFSGSLLYRKGYLKTETSLHQAFR